MARTALKGNSVETTGELPEVGSKAPDFTLTKTDLSSATPKEYLGKRIVMNIFPSIDTPVCAASARRFNKEASALTNTIVMCISADLPFAHQRFCEIEGLNDVVPLSVFRSNNFGKEYGVTIASGALAGLLARAIIIIDAAGKIEYSYLAPEITEEPDYDSALTFLNY